MIYRHEEASVGRHFALGLHEQCRDHREGELALEAISGLPARGQDLDGLSHVHGIPRSQTSTCFDRGSLSGASDIEQSPAVSGGHGASVATEADLDSRAGGALPDREDVRVDGCGHGWRSWFAARLFARA